MTLKPEHAMRILLDRLNWPVRFVRWQSAKEFAALFSSPQQAIATHVFLGWLKSRQLESEVVAGMAVLMCAPPASLPSADDVKCNIEASSILADILFQRMYRKPLGAWHNGHSGPAPANYEADKYFEEHKGQVIPLILSTDLQHLQDESGLPFQKQWAFEWRKLMDTTNAPYSSYPYHFMNRVQGREGIGGQFSQVQCNVYRSAFLRTLAFAVQQWGMPRNLAAIKSARCLPLSKGLLALRPVTRPSWLEDIPEKCCKPDAPLETLARQLVKPNIGSRGMRPISLRIPISNAVAEFGELSIESFYASDDFCPRADFSDDHTRMLYWPITDLISFEGDLPDEAIDEYRVEGATGWCVPLCLNLWPSSSGFWQNDYFHLGIASVAPYLFDTPLRVELVKGSIGFSSSGTRIGNWKTWNDNWTPVHARDGHTRCGGVTDVKMDVLKSAATRLGADLAWHVQLKMWKREREYTNLVLTTRSQFFRD